MEVDWGKQVHLQVRQRPHGHMAAATGCCLQGCVCSRMVACCTCHMLDRLGGFALQHLVCPGFWQRMH